MVKFKWVVQESFLNNPSHPITIPACHHTQLENEGLIGKAKIACLDSLLSGQIYTSHPSGRSRYYQVRMQSDSCIKLVGLKSGDIIMVEIKSVDDDVHVTIDLPPPPMPSKKRTSKKRFSLSEEPKPYNFRTRRQ